MSGYGVARACPFPAGHDMWAQFIVSWLSKSEHAQVLAEVKRAIQAMPAQYATELEVDVLIGELDERLDSLGSPF